MEMSLHRMVACVVVSKAQQRIQIPVLLLGETPIGTLPIWLNFGGSQK
jgi:hypothetical protein